VQITCPRVKTDGENYREFTEAACMMVTIIMQQQGLEEAEAIEYLKENHPTIIIYKDELPSGSDDAD
jgi:hypothetical protein